MLIVAVVVAAGLRMLFAGPIGALARSDPATTVELAAAGIVEQIAIEFTAVATVIAVVELVITIAAAATTVVVMVTGHPR